MIMEQINIYKLIILTLNFRLIIRQYPQIKSFRNTMLNLTLNNKIIKEMQFKSKIMKLKLIVINMVF